MISSAKVTAALRASKLEVKPYERQGFWSVVFEVDGKSKTAFLFAPKGSEYFIIMAPLDSKKLASKLEAVSADTLRTVMRLSSEAMLAKVEYVDTDDSPGFIAASECSIDGFTGKKLHRRLEACAKLALRVESALLKESR